MDQQPPLRVTSMQSCSLQVADLSIQDTESTSNTFAQETSKVRKSRRHKRDKQKKVQEAAAETAALYYGECYVQGVGGNAADRAAKEVHNKYKKWWLQDFNGNDNGLMGSVGDAHLLPRFNEPGQVSSKKSEVEKVRDEKVSSKVVDDVKPKPTSDNNTPIDDNNTNNNDDDGPKPKTYYTVTDCEYGNDMNFQIGGSANAAATATHQDDFNNIDSGRSTPHVNNYTARRQIYSDNVHQANFMNQATATTATTNAVPAPAPAPVPVVETYYDCSQRAKNPSPVLNKVDDYDQYRDKKISPDSSKQAHSHSRKKRQRPKSKVSGDLSTFFSLQPPVSKVSESEEAFQKEKSKRCDIQRRGSTNSDYDSEILPRKSSSFFHEVGRRGSITNNAASKNAAWEYESNPILQEAQIPTSDAKISAILTSRGTPNERRAKHIDNAKLSLLHTLAVSGGDVTSQPFLFALEQLRILYNATEWDARDDRGIHRDSKKAIEGMWLSLSRPNYNECLGKNSAGEYMYTMGRMSFDMFAPNNLVCSIQGIFNHIQVVDLAKDRHTLKSVPKSLKDEIDNGRSIVRKYDIVTAFTVEPDSPQFGTSSANKCVQKGLRGIITTYGYVLPDPKTPNRLSIWFSGGKIEANKEDNNLPEWNKAFGGGSFKRHLQERARLLAAKLLLGAEAPEKLESNGSMEFNLHRPIGGHGTAYVDVLYLDETLRIVQGHRGSLYVFSRVS